MEPVLGSAKTGVLFRPCSCLGSRVSVSAKSFSEGGEKVRVVSGVLLKDGTGFSF